ncbi:PAS domain S-box-containing protein/diguanylate cyclase (GGDEF)-like protein [Paraburkholderia eburnea]|uniref:PAS domain S-box-containing protein/diguanylate cyclase (GGDEF)-like protein n=1 Tax=Paraburkholderia eburnea TaxID=1189126 RepID=A0A2S4LWR1_9BURK|nr:PAS domain S-box-containing protein/diguanylate cyclase (GGDEF)-like protein [Paraburkholderia eburnea]PRZ17995.1 PAS domain S-box-containing protein/diguanylate cyclase (GGDEF)-like protein [Paraburkholderia eburnea]
MERRQSHNRDWTSHSECPDERTQASGVPETGSPLDDRNIESTAGNLDPQRIVRRDWDALDPTIRWVADSAGVLGQIVGPDGATADSLSPRLVGRHWRTLVPPDDHPIIERALGECLSDGHLLDVRCRFAFGTGDALWYRTRAIACRDASGRVMGWHGRSENIHQQVLAEEALRGSEEHYRYTVQLNPGIPWTATADGLIEEVSPRWMEATGQSVDAVKGIGWLDALHPDDVAPTVAAWQAALRSGNPVDVEYRINGRDGGYRWVRARAQARRNSLGEIVRWYGTLEDIDDRKAAENALRENEQRFRLAVRAAELGVWDLDRQTGWEVWSDELKAMFGLSADENPQAETVSGLMHPDDRDRLKSALAAPDDGSRQQEFDATLRIRRADDGRERWLSARGWKTFLPSGALKRALVTFRDITDERTADERIRWMATHDALTGLPNRLAFQHEVERLIELDVRDQDAGLAILIADVDDLKGTNDQIGHDAGDALLCALAERLREVLPAQSFIARLGGDEFGIALPSVSRADIHDIGTAVGARLRQPLSYAQRVLDCRASIGVACFPEHGTDATDLLKATDTALYAAKATARGGMTVFHPDMRRKARERAEMIARARRAVDADRIRPFYQPKVDLQSGRITGFEALLRWHTGDGQMLPPAGIAAAFENVELAVELHELMFSNILADVHRWLDAGLPFGRIAINAAAAQFMHDDFAEELLSRLATERVSADCFEVEVTETVFLGRSAEGVGRALRMLSDEGVRIALDDFGTGYASLTHLQAFPVHTIKIDRSFMADLDTQPGNVAIVEAVVALSHKLGMDTVAEGVEQASQCDFLRRCGCDSVQGFLFSPAIAPQGVPALLQQSWIT